MAEFWNPTGSHDIEKPAWWALAMASSTSGGMGTPPR